MSRLHLMFRFDDAAVPELAALRHRWDPAMAAKVPPHVTLTYPQELSDEAELIERGREAAAAVAPFTMHASVVGCDNDGSGGVWIEIDDRTGSWVQLRAMIVPDGQVDVDPHLTIVHPRTSAHGPEAWTALRADTFQASLTASEFLLIATESDESNQVLHRFPLTGGGR